MAWGCRGRQGPGEQVEGYKTASERQAVESKEMEGCLDRRSKTGTRVENWVQRAVQISIRVADGRGGQYTEGERDRSRKHANGGTGF